MVVEKLHFLDSLNYLLMCLKSIPNSLDLICKERYYTQFFNTANKLDYVGSHSEPKFYGADIMSGDERTQIWDWYKGVKDKMFYNREEMLVYYMDDVNVLRQICCTFWNLFYKLAKLDPFRQAIKISTISNKVSGPCI